MSDDVLPYGRLRECQRRYRDGHLERWIQQLVRTPEGDEWRDLPVWIVPLDESPK